MPRALRIHVPGGFYHVTLRGNHRQRIFFRDNDRSLLESIVAEVITRFDASIHAYCWMTNHIHLLVQVSEIPLGRLMLCIASRYARAVQTRLATTGHLFERRFHAVLVDADSYLLELVRYIHLNPVRARMVADPIDYPWSGHHAYLDPSRTTWLTTARALRMLQPQPSLAIDAYQRFMSCGEIVRWGSGVLTPHPDDCRILGDDQFATRALGTDWQPRLRQTLEELIVECCQRFGLTAATFASPSRARHLARARAWIAHRAVAGRIASISAVARRLGRNESAIRQVMSRYPPPASDS
jgi:REP element-mobilizing transposase RayT